jgi:hypothetical protein
MNWHRSAVLFGGEGNGYTVKLDALHPTVTVFQNGGPPFALAGDLQRGSQPHAQRLGVYELVEPIGPDVPVYVATRS